MCEVSEDRPVWDEDTAGKPIAGIVNYWLTDRLGKSECAFVGFVFRVRGFAPRRYTGTMVEASSGMRRVPTLRLWWLLCWLSPPTSAHSIIPLESEATGNGYSGCFVRLVRRTSKSTPCYPDGRAEFSTKGGGRFGCIDNSTVTVAGHCAGLFACGNGYTTMCPIRDAATGQWNYSCQCLEPCHRNWYMQGDLQAKGLACGPMPPPSPLIPPVPPLPPVPPQPPAPVSSPDMSSSNLKASDGPADASFASCDPWCSKREGKAKTKICKCAACTEEEGALAMGAPCHNGKATPGAVPAAVVATVATTTGVAQAATATAVTEAAIATVVAISLDSQSSPPSPRSTAQRHNGWSLG